MKAIVRPLRIARASATTSAPPRALERRAARSGGRVDERGDRAAVHDVGEARPQFRAHRHVKPHVPDLGALLLGRDADVVPEGDRRRPHESEQALALGGLRVLRGLGRAGHGIGPDGLFFSPSGRSDCGEALPPLDIDERRSLTAAAAERAVRWIRTEAAREAPTA